jgi:hypothetical protein
MSGLRDYGSFYWCDTCDSMYQDSEWDSDARSCVYCAAVTLLEEEE